MKARKNVSRNQQFPELKKTFDLSKISKSSSLGQYDTVVDPRSLTNDQFRGMVENLLDRLGLCVVVNKSPDSTFGTARVEHKLTAVALDKNIVAQRVSSIRVAKDISIVCLAYNAHITPPTLVDIERGAKKLTPVLIQNLARALNVTVADLSS